MPTEAPVYTPQTKQNTQLEQPWNVVIHDDPVNLMQYVTKAIMKIFGYPEPKAQHIMMEIHTKGRSIAWSGGKERAELYVQQLHSLQLTATMERAQ